MDKDSSGLVVLLLLLVAGLLAIGLPKVTRRDRRRSWHPWLNSGLLPLLFGMALAPALGDVVAEALRPLLALATAAAGVLAGSQLRIAYLQRAGRGFLQRQSASALLVFVLTALIAWSLLIVLGLPLAQSLSWSGLTGAICVATSQRSLPVLDFEVRHRDVVLGHVAPAGWWNIIALALGGGVLSLVHGGPVAVLAGSVSWVQALLELGLPLLLGIALGWLASRARNRDEGYLFLLAVLGTAGGMGLALGSAPLFTGLLLGATFANVVLGRAGLMEGPLEELEQPVVVATGLLAGLCLGDWPRLWTASLTPQWSAWLLAALFFAGRWILRGRFSPTSPLLAARGERRYASAGATGVLLLGCLVSIGGEPMLLVPALALAEAALTGLAWSRERRVQLA